MKPKLTSQTFYLESYLTDYDTLEYDVKNRWMIDKKDGYTFSERELKILVLETWECAINAMFDNMSESGIDREAVLAQKEKYMRELL